MEIQDPDKLFDLALQASQANDPQKSIGILKSAIEQSPEDARMWYMLASLYTDIGIYDKAIHNMEKALQIDPNYAIARFHLGLLQLTSGNRELANTTWLPLNALGETHYLVLFKTGLLHIADDDIEQGILLIRQGIDQNHVVESLNEDMETVIEHASLSLGAQANNPST
ncbi:MAG: tetratricopeptide repeat protein [Gammaproteobacteria bacterium]|jgi:tetratricopeptide (TPR) repeat protein|nr:tetratricopeptide repeat protein [Gammaproteobacteria bacterium]